MLTTNKFVMFTDQNELGSPILIGIGAGRLHTSWEAEFTTGQGDILSWTRGKSQSALCSDHWCKSKKPGSEPASQRMEIRIQPNRQIPTPPSALPHPIPPPSCILKPPQRRDDLHGLCSSIPRLVAASCFSPAPKSSAQICLLAQMQPCWANASDMCQPRIVLLVNENISLKYME